MTLGTQWQFKPSNEQYKEGTRMIEILSNIRSKGGALLLNIGPKPGGEIPSQQENVLREMAAWNFINRECIYRVRPWIVPNEGDIIFTRAKNSNTVYAILTNQENWTFGARKKFVLKSLSATDSTEVSVLGQNDRVVEYQTGKNPKTRFEQTQKGLDVSCVRAQRIYNNRKWPNPVVLKLGNIEPALVPPDIHTVQVDGNAKSIELRIDDLGDQDKLKLSYLYRPYAGFVEELYQEGWKKGSNTITIDQPGVYTISIPEKLQGVHQFRAAALHPSGVNIKGNVKRANF
jgi:alpha-L-fucosidase